MARLMRCKGDDRQLATIERHMRGMARGAGRDPFANRRRRKATQCPESGLTHDFEQVAW
jgi:hypothetical protein